MKAVSEVVSTLIVSGTIIVVSLIIFFYALYNVQSSINSAEFGYIRTVFYSIATNIPNIVEGGSFGANTPSRIVGIGYINLSDVTIHISIENETTTLLDYASTPKALEATAYAALITSNTTLYGCNCYIVNDTGLLSRIQALYYGGATHLRLDTARVYIRIYLFKEDSVTRYVVNILYLELKPEIISTHPTRLVVYASKNIVSKTYSNISNIEITYTNTSGTYTTTLHDLLPSLSSNDIVDANIVVKEVSVVIA